jgi:hypothetical protein
MGTVETFEMQQAKLCEKLDEKIPREAVKSRSQGGASLDYVDTYYVIDRLNKVFGNLTWSMETKEMTLLEGTQKPSYRAKVQLIVRLPDGGICVKEGTGYGSDKGALNPHEMACKEAESDALKRAAMKFGQSLGLALYDKTQENVEDAPAKPARRASNTGGVKAVEPRSVASANPVASDAQGGPGAGPALTLTRKVPQTPDEANLLISSLAKVAIDKKRKTLTDLKTDMQTLYGVEKKEQLQLAQAQDFVGKLYDVIQAAH